MQILPFHGNYLLMSNRNAYSIVVASSPDLLPDKADLWESGVGITIESCNNSDNYWSIV